MKHRFLLLIMIGLFSLSLVTVTLVAAGVAQGKAQTPAGSTHAIPLQANNPNGGSSAELTAAGQLKPAPPLTATYEISRFGLWIDSSGWTRLWGEVTPVVTVTVWLPHEPFSLTSSADPSCPGCFVFTSTTTLYPGDVLSVSTGGGDPPVTILIPDPLEAHVDSAAGNLVWGQIGGWYTQEVKLYNPGGWLINTTTTNATGNFTTTWVGMERGNPGYISFVDQIDSTSVIFQKAIADLEPQIHVNYEGEVIEGDYEAGHTLWFTVTNATGETKAVVSGTTGSLAIWGGWSGWSTNANFPWEGAPPDIQPGDYVYVQVDNGRAGVVHIPEITGYVNENTDAVYGNLVGDWLTGTVYVGCALWYPPGPGMGTSAEPPDYSFSCDYAGSFDILPGMFVGVDYREADNDQVYNVIWSFNHVWLPVLKKP
jgi:hypothetical protein